MRFQNVANDKGKDDQKEGITNIINFWNLKKNNIWW